MFLNVQKILFYSQKKKNDIRSEKTIKVIDRYKEKLYKCNRPYEIRVPVDRAGALKRAAYAIRKDTRVLCGHEEAVFRLRTGSCNIFRRNKRTKQAPDVNAFWCSYQRDLKQLKIKLNPYIFFLIMSYKALCSTISSKCLVLTSGKEDTRTLSSFVC